jgi:hypothetical protein
LRRKEDWENGKYRMNIGRLGREEIRSEEEDRR